MRMLIPLALVALIGLAPSGVQAQDASPACPDGQVETPEGCSQQAWVDDCPPEQMCAAGADEPQSYGAGDCIECSGPVDEPSEPIQYGEDGCIDCTGAPVEDPAASDAQSKDSPTLPVLGLLALVGVAALLSRRF
jgi:hypothetical protein